jgi:hypothetical protein
MLLHRHLSGAVFEKQHWEKHVFCESAVGLASQSWRICRKIASRIARTRWHRFARDMEVLDPDRLQGIFIEEIEKLAPHKYE